eukprot:scaffold220530_cov29-Tisochrysis_lutea.AAC.1
MQMRGEAGVLGLAGRKRGAVRASDVSRMKRRKAPREFYTERARAGLVGESGGGEGQAGGTEGAGCERASAMCRRRTDPREREEGEEERTEERDACSGEREREESSIGRKRPEGLGNSLAPPRQESPSEKT